MSSTRSRTLGPFVAAGLVVGLVLAVLVSPFASSSPDGLEKVAEDQGFAESAGEHGLAGSPLADYGVEGVADERLATGLSGLVGTLLTFAVAGGLVLVVRRSAARRTEHAAAGG